MTEWINIEYELPPEYTYVLTFTPPYGYKDENWPLFVELEIGRHAKIKWVFSNVRKQIMSSKSRFYKVTHWMPLPGPPND